MSVEEIELEPDGRCLEREGRTDLDEITEAIEQRWPGAISESAREASRALATLLQGQAGVVFEATSAAMPTPWRLLIFGDLLQELSARAARFQRARETKGVSDDRSDAAAHHARRPGG